MDPIEIFDNHDCWKKKFSETMQNRAIQTLENGKILFFPQLAFALVDNEADFLSPHYANPKSKNISFDSRHNTLRGARCASSQQTEQLKSLLGRFAKYARGFIEALLPRYVSLLQQGRTSLRPVEVKGRVSSYRKDDTRLHVDAFPANPNQGRRILRVFCNINPEQYERVWRVGEPFAETAKRFLPQIRYPVWGTSHLLALLKITKGRRSEYDHIMLQLHNRMKADQHYQQTVPQTEIRFPAQTTWVVQTDHVSHAAISGQHALEQTFYLPIHAMQDESLSPLRILEKLTGKKLVSYAKHKRNLSSNSS